MTGWLNIDIGFRTNRYIIEISFFSSDWSCFGRWMPDRGVYALQVGPFVLALTDRLKLRQYADSYNTLKDFTK